MAFGGVAAGSIKAREAEIVAGSMKISGLISILIARPANTGKKVSTVATFELSSARSTALQTNERDPIL
mgnify:CR=1 FL=1